MSHTKEPWAADEFGQINDSEGKPIVGHPYNARRIVACVNACAGLPNDALDGGWTAAGLSEYAKRLEQQRDELLAAAKNLRDVKGRHHSEQAFNALVAAIAKVEASK